jgi:manganese/iron transport system substrate-binding protein
MSLQSWTLGLSGTALSLTIALLTSCSSTSSTSSNSPNSAKPTVVASYSVLCDLTKEIVQDTVDLKCLIPGGKDPHTYSPTPDDRKAIETAKLVLYGGYDFEPEVIKLVKASTAQNAIAIHELAVPKPIMAEDGHDHGAEHKDGAAKGKAEADPHVWHNVKNGIAIVQVLKIQLSQASPANTALYEKNAKDLTDRLSKLDTWITKSVATIPPTSRKLVTTHDALTYYGQAYGIPIEGALQGISTTEKPSAQRIAELVSTIKSSQVPTLFAELSVNPKLIETVSKESNVKLSATPLVADGLGEPGSPSDTYEKMMRENTKAIVVGLGGKAEN